MIYEKTCPYLFKNPVQDDYTKYRAPYLCEILTITCSDFHDGACEPLSCPKQYTPREVSFIIYNYMKKHEPEEAKKIKFCQICKVPLIYPSKGHNYIDGKPVCLTHLRLHMNLEDELFIAKKKRGGL